MPEAQGVMRWPSRRPNLTAIAKEAELPLDDQSVDRVLIAHLLESTERMSRVLREVWRVLADGGEIIVIAPNRRGLWCLSEQTPFGQGRPFSAAQLKQVLRNHLFAPQKTGFALFVPPLRSRLLLNTALAWERVGLRIAHQFGGALVMRAEKRIYGATGVPAEAVAKRPAYAHLGARPAIAAERATDDRAKWEPVPSPRAG
jgi:SAM-dependent methyltransferase